MVWCDAIVKRDVMKDVMRDVLSSNSIHTKTKTHTNTQLVQVLRTSMGLSMAVTSCEFSKVGMALKTGRKIDSNLLPQVDQSTYMCVM